eukprot:TRINITY_DN17547_c0_g1_i1.p1 TRINITY_DN17547_c0_g1~~TRINITY_DN17547_c0_g1_i1.p1  ORF type:complete len:203 (-),score=70.64 TRINITY_DN17547_c0_g1_i1:257-865(-)
MLRHSVRSFVRAGRSLRLRYADAGEGGAPALLSKEELRKEWKKVAPNLDLPKFPGDLLPARQEVPSSIPEKVTFNFLLPHDSLFEKEEVDQVILPATTGQMGVLPGHVPTVAQLRPGLLEISKDSETTKFFVSSGFAFIHANSVTDVIAVEAVPLDRLDPEEVKKGLNEYVAKLAAAESEEDKAEAQIGVEVHSAMSGALGV